MIERISRRDFFKGIVGISTPLIFPDKIKTYPTTDIPSKLDHVEERERDPYLSGIKQTKLSAEGLDNRIYSPLVDLRVNEDEFSVNEAYKLLDRLALNVFSRLEQTSSYKELEDNLQGVIKIPSINQEQQLAERLRKGEDAVIEIYGIDPTKQKKEVKPLQLHAKEGWSIKLVNTQGLISLEDLPSGNQKRGVTFSKVDDRLQIEIYHADEEFQPRPEYPGLRTKDKAMSVAIGKDVYEALIILIFTKGDPYLWRTYKDDIERDSNIWGNSEVNYTIPDLTFPLLGTYWPSYGDFIGPSTLQVISKTG